MSEGGVQIEKRQDNNVKSESGAERKESPSQSYSLDAMRLLEVQSIDIAKKPAQFNPRFYKEAIVGIESSSFDVSTKQQLQSLKEELSVIPEDAQDATILETLQKQDYVFHRKVIQEILLKETSLTIDSISFGVLMDTFKGSRESVNDMQHGSQIVQRIVTDCMLRMTADEIVNFIENFNKTTFIFGSLIVPQNLQHLIKDDLNRNFQAAYATALALSHSRNVLAGQLENSNLVVTSPPAIWDVGFAIDGLVWDASVGKVIGFVQAKSGSTKGNWYGFDGVRNTVDENIHPFDTNRTYTSAVIAVKPEDFTGSTTIEARSKPQHLKYFLQGSKTIAETHPEIVAPNYTMHFEIVNLKSNFDAVKSGQYDSSQFVRDLSDDIHGNQTAQRAVA